MGKVFFFKYAIKRNSVLFYNTERFTLVRIGDTEAAEVSILLM